MCVVLSLRNWTQTSKELRLTLFSTLIFPFDGISATAGQIINTSMTINISMCVSMEALHHRRHRLETSTTNFLTSCITKVKKGRSGLGFWTVFT